VDGCCRRPIVVAMEEMADYLGVVSVQERVHFIPRHGFPSGVGVDR